MKSIFSKYHPLSSNITRCQVSSRVRTWFHDSAVDNDFDYTSGDDSQCLPGNQNQVFYMKVLFFGVLFDLFVCLFVCVCL